jgi:uncharacterized membrane protein YfcA
MKGFRSIAVNELLQLSWFLPGLLVVFVTAAFQGATGFGMALLAVPLMMALSTPHIAVPFVTLTALSSIIAMIVRYRAHADRSLILWLAVPSLVTAPAGVYALLVMTHGQLSAAVGAILVASGTWALFKKRREALALAEAGGTAAAPKPPSRVKYVVVGGVSGVLGGALGMTGPLLAEYLISSGISRDAFKVTLNWIFLLSALWRVGLYIQTDVLSQEVLLAALAGVPIAYLGARVGMQLDRYLPTQRFQTCVQCALVLIGVWLAGNVLFT